MSATATALLTAEDFWLLPDHGGQRSLVRGEVVEAMPTGVEHAFVASAFVEYLRRWARETNNGKVGQEAGFILARDPDVVRAPDAFFIRKDRLPSGRFPRAFWDQAPDLAVEVVSPSETAEDVREKVRDSLAAGTPLVLVAYARTREVIAHTPDGLARTYREGDTLTNPDILPGFACQVSALFE